jgi:hypothetical protein
MSETALNELTANLLPPSAENQSNAYAGNISQKPKSLCPPLPVPDNILMANKKSIDDTISFRYKSLIDKGLPIPAQFSVIKSRIGREINWNTETVTQNSELIFTLMIFERVRGGGYCKKVLTLTRNKKFLIPRKSDFNPARVFFGIVSVNNCGYQSSFPKLFRIRGRRIIFN